MYKKGLIFILISLAFITPLYLNGFDLNMSAFKPVDVSNILNQSTPTLQNISNVSQFNLFTEADNKKVQLAFLSSNTGLPGSLLEITGSGFLSKDNEVYFGKHVISHVSSLNANKINITVPNSIPPGVYDIEVSNSKGKSESVSYFIITKLGSVAPTITSVTPAVAKIGDLITINGDHFTPTDNTVHSSLGTFENLSSKDGKTIQLTLKAPTNLPELELLFEIDDTYEFKVFMSVANVYGESDKYGSPGLVTLQ